MRARHRDGCDPAHEPSAPRAARARPSTGLALALFAGALVPALGAMQDRGGRGGEPPPAEDPAPAEEGSAEDVAATYFAICDYNSDGRITFKEAQPSLGLDHEGFAAYDIDRDGYIGSEEFSRRHAKILEHGGAFPPPVAKAKTRKATKRTPEQMLELYDKNHDQRFDERELKTVLDDYGITELAPAVALEKLDKDGSKEIETAEIPDLLVVLDPALGTQTSKKKAKSILELFGKKTEREIRDGSTPLPPLIVGPVPAFRRLDLDNDGAISMQDLTNLQRPIQLPVRVNALMATLDTDQDGVISEEEFWSSMRNAKR